MSDGDLLGPQIVVALDLGDIDGALALIDAAVASAPPFERSTFLLLRGRLLLALGDPAQASEAFTDALTGVDDLDQQGEALLARAEAAEVFGDIASARADLDRARDIFENEVRRAGAEHVLGRIERDHGDLDLAIELLRDAHAVLDLVDDTPAGREQFVEVTLDLAMALRLTGDAGQALDLLLGLPDDLSSPLRARVLLQLGTTYGFAGDPARALAAYDQALALLSHPLERAATRYNRAVVLREAGRLSEAFDDLQQSLAENDDTDPAIAFDALLLAGIIARERDDLQASLDALRAATELVPDGERHGRARLELGTTLAATGLYGLAIEELSVALALCTEGADRARALRLRGLSRREMGQHGAALADIEAALVLTADPDEHARATMAASALLASLGNRREALDRSGTLLLNADDDEGRLHLLVQRGALRSELGDLDGATSDLEAAAELAQRTGDSDLRTSILADLGAIYLATGQSALARQALREAAALGVSGEAAFLALMNLGNQLLSEGAVFEALDAWEQAAAAAEDDRDARAHAFVTRANALLRYAEYAPAEADFTRALTLSPSAQITDQATIGLQTVQGELEAFASYREQLTRMIAALDSPVYRASPTFDRALLALTTGNYDDALIDATRATNLYRLKRECAKAHALLALVHTAKGDCDEALAALADADRLDPERGWHVLLAEDWRWQRCPEVTAVIN
ncbi:MAG: tetratricopeptide repeat protein [Chloroflexota bacterium]|nr:tetratricopeptide repeat protein [Chloroflexota bacterium]